MSKGLRVRNTLVNGGMTGIDEKIDKVFAYKQGNNYSTAKKRVKASNPNTEAQQLIRNTFTQTSAGWSGLTEIERGLWNTTAPEWVNTGIFGDKKQTGKNLYTGVNIRLVNAGKDMISVPGTRDFVTQLENGSIEVNAGVVEYLLGVVENSPNEVIVLSLTRQLSAGTSVLPTTTKFQNNVVVIPSNIALDITAVYEDKYGPLINGQKIGYDISLISAGGNKVSLYSNIVTVQL